MNRLLVRGTLIIVMITGGFAVGAFVVRAQTTSHASATADQLTRAEAKRIGAQEKADAADAALTASIQSAIVGDRRLQSSGRNLVEVIAQGGNVTLKGQVDTPQEKERIAERAASIAGGHHVSDEIELAPIPKPVDEKAGRIPHPEQSAPEA